MHQSVEWFYTISRAVDLKRTALTVCHDNVATRLIRRKLRIGAGAIRRLAMHHRAWHISASACDHIRISTHELGGIVGTHNVFLLNFSFPPSLPKRPPVSLCKHLPHTHVFLPKQTTLPGAQPAHLPCMQKRCDDLTNFVLPYTLTCFLILNTSD